MIFFNLPINHFTFRPYVLCTETKTSEIIPTKTAPVRSLRKLGAPHAIHAKFTRGFLHSCVTSKLDGECLVKFRLRSQLSTFDFDVLVHNVSHINRFYRLQITAILMKKKGKKFARK